MEFNIIFYFAVLLASSLANPINLSNPQYNKELFEGDILGIEPMSLNGVEPRNAIRDPSLLWPNRVIPYVVSSQYDKFQIKMINDAIAEYHNRTCLRFVPRTSEFDYISIAPLGTGCNSYVGRIGGPQSVSLDPACFVIGIVLHEFMHAAGFYHEQSRTDRDDYVIINWSNIQEGLAYAFENYGQDVIQHLGAPYDYGSVMHYEAYAFAIDRNIKTIITRQEGVEIGQTRGFSDVDVFKVNALYSCAAETV